MFKLEFYTENFALMPVNCEYHVNSYRGTIFI